jgi:hypothetical protein
MSKKSCRSSGDPSPRERRDEVMRVVLAVAPQLGVTSTCSAFGVSRATYYRHRRPLIGPRRRRPSPPRRLPDQERRQVLAVLNEPKFADLAPAEAYSTRDCQIFCVRGGGRLTIGDTPLEVNSKLMQRACPSAIASFPGLGDISDGQEQELERSVVAGHVAASLGHLA